MLVEAVVVDGQKKAAEVEAAVDQAAAVLALAQLLVEAFQHQIVAVAVVVLLSFQAAEALHVMVHRVL
jgi:hypothetical protein